MMTLLRFAHRSKLSLFVRRLVHGLLNKTLPRSTRQRCDMATPCNSFVAYPSAEIMNEPEILFGLWRYMNLIVVCVAGARSKRPLLSDETVVVGIPSGGTNAPPTNPSAMDGRVIHAPRTGAPVSASTTLPTAPGACMLV